MVKLPLVPNKAYKPDGKAALIRAAHRYGWKNVEHGFYYTTGGRHSKVLRKAQPTSPATGNSTASTGTTGETEVPVTDVSSDLEYVVAVKIGTPGVTLKLDFDTGSSDLWVWSSEFTKATSAESAQHTIYNPKNSSSAKDVSGATWKISYGDGSSASGNVYSDTVSIGTIAISGQEVELAEKLSSSFLSGDSDGLLGLAWPSINTVTPTPAKTPVENMISQGLISSPLFSVKLTKGGADGFYTFGEVDSSVTSSELLYTPVDNSQGFWAFPSTTWTLNGQTQTVSGGTAIADTGTTLCLVSDAQVKAIYDAIPGSKLDSTQGGYVYPQDATVPTLEFAVGENLFTLNAEDFAYGEPDSDGFVFGGVQSVGDLGMSIYGDVFLKSVYVVFDQGNTRIGMAQRT